MADRDVIARALNVEYPLVITLAEQMSKTVLAALAAEGRVITDADDVLWLRALREAGVDNWQGIEHAMDIRDAALAAAGGDDG